MKADIKQRWVEALRSGSYNQGTRYLARLDQTTNEWSFCCLGVLCDLAEQEGVAEHVGDTVRQYWGANEDKNRPGFHAASSTTLPAEVWEWAGLEDFNPSISLDDHPRTLAGLNDDGITFAEIADVIEEKL